MKNFSTFVFINASVSGRFSDGADGIHNNVWSSILVFPRCDDNDQLEMW